MPVRQVTRGYLPDITMPAGLAAGRGEKKLFADLHDKVLMKSVRPNKTTAGYKSTYLIPHEPPVYDQLDIGSCVLNATCGALNVLLAAQGGHTEELARLFLYWLCRMEMGTLNEDSGTYTHLAVERIGTIGVCQENMWQYSDENFLMPNGHAVAPGPECFPAASDNKPTGWASIAGTGATRLEQMEAAIRHDHPIIFGATVGSNIQDYQPGQVITIPKDNIGGHAMVVTGVVYKQGVRTWRIRNSWGADYGENGHLYIDDAYAGWAEFDDLWALTMVDPLMF